MKHLEFQYKALANRRRLAILKYLKYHNKASVGDIAKEIKLRIKSTSKHLRILSAVDFFRPRTAKPERFFFLPEK